MGIFDPPPRPSLHYYFTVICNLAFTMFFGQTPLPPQWVHTLWMAPGGQSNANEKYWDKIQFISYATYCNWRTTKSAFAHGAFGLFLFFIISLFISVICSLVPLEKWYRYWTIPIELDSVVLQNQSLTKEGLISGGSVLQQSLLEFLFQKCHNPQNSLLSY